MTEEIMSIRSEVDDLRDSATYIERMLDAIGKDGNSLMAKVAWLERENAKLKELVRDMWRAIPKTESCGCDSSANTCTGSDECRGECALWHRMRDLDVEVDE